MFDEKHSPGPWSWEVVEDGDAWLMHAGDGETPLDPPLRLQ